MPPSQYPLVAHALLTGQLAMKHSWPRGSAAGEAASKRQIVALGISEACIEETGQEEYIIKQLPPPPPGPGKGEARRRGWGGRRQKQRGRGKRAETNTGRRRMDGRRERTEDKG